MNENEIAKIERRQLVSGGDLEQDYKDIRALIAEVRATGARIRLIPDGDVAGAIATAWPDMMPWTGLGSPLVIGT